MSLVLIDFFCIHVLDSRFAPPLVYVVLGVSRDFIVGAMLLWSVSHNTTWSLYSASFYFKILCWSLSSSSFEF